MADIRITGGSIKGKKLAILTEGPHRYTSGKVREALFNMTGDVDGLNILDLYAGAGTFSIECLSRGASSVTAVESAERMYAVLRKNVMAAGFERDTVLLNMEVSRAIPLLHKKNSLYDIIFMDPPYGKDLILSTMNTIMEYPLHTHETLFILEYSKKDSLHVIPRLNLREATIKKYGDTMIHLFTLPHSTAEGADYD